MRNTPAFTTTVWLAVNDFVPTVTTILFVLRATTVSITLVPTTLLASVTVAWIDPAVSSTLTCAP